MSDCKHDWHFVQGLTERLRCLRCGVMTWPKSVEERTQEMLADVLTVGSAWSKGGERIDPASVFKDHETLHSCSYHCDRPECIKAQRDELREALAQPEQEPVEWQHRKPIMDSQGNTRGYSDWLPGRGLERWPHRRLYTTPPQRMDQEPVALVIDGVLVKSELPEKYTGHLYTTPPRRKPEQEPIKESSVTHSHLWIGELWRKEKNT